VVTGERHTFGQMFGWRGCSLTGLHSCLMLGNGDVHYLRG